MVAATSGAAIRFYAPHRLECIAIGAGLYFLSVPRLILRC